VCVLQLQVHKIKLAVNGPPFSGENQFQVTSSELQGKTSCKLQVVSCKLRETKLAVVRPPSTERAAGRLQRDAQRWKKFYAMMQGQRTVTFELPPFFEAFVD